MDYEQLYYDLYQDVEELERTIEEQIEKVLSVNLCRRARMMAKEQPEQNPAEGELLEYLRGKAR